MFSIRQEKLGLISRNKNERRDAEEMVEIAGLVRVTNGSLP